MTSVRIIGPGRAGGALARALGRAGWRVHPLVGRDGDTAGAAHDVDLVVIAVPDRAVAEVAATIDPDDTAVVAHLSGSLGLNAVAGHARPAAVHPLVSLPSAEVGATRLVGAWFAVAGDPLVDELVTALEGRSVTVADEQRAAYHAAACVAANHLVALMGQVERIAAPAGVPLEAFLDLAGGALDNVAAMGPEAALTGPVARGDHETVERHRAAIDPTELPAYDALAAAAARLVA